MKVLDIDNIKKVASSVERSPSGNLKSTIMRARKIIAILERDNYQCVECPNKEELTIDHINGRKFAKHDNHLKYKLDKCRVLCNKCHMEKNKNEKNV